MINNDVLRSIRYMLDLSDGKVVEIAHLADPDFALDIDEVRAFLLKEDDPGYLACRDAVLAHFLDGLVVHLRGRDERLPARPVEKRISNNVVLKKLRVAFELKDVDMHQVFEDAGFPVTVRVERGADIAAACGQLRRQAELPGDAIPVEAGKGA